MRTTRTLAILFCLIISMQLSWGQGVGINNSNANPDASAMLDVSSTTKGMLIPRMSTAQRNAIPTPATGLLVFDNTTSSFWFYDGTQWTELITNGGDSDWTVNGADMYNNNTGNVGIGTTTPVEALQVVGNVQANIFYDNNNTGYYLDPSNTNTAVDIAGDILMISNRHIETQDGDESIEISDDNPAWHGETYGGVVRIKGDGNANTGKLEVGGIQVFRNVSIDAGDDATGTVGSGVLEIANALRLDGNEMITNDGTPLYLQNDNNGDLRVDGTTFAVDASTNRVGIGTTTPARELHVEGTARGQVLEFGTYNLTATNVPNVDGQLYRADGQAQIEVDDWFYIRDNDETVRLRLNTDGGRVECGPGAYGGEAMLYGGYISGNSVSDGHRLYPNRTANSTVGWGYVGVANYEWWYMYADNYANTSRRETKKDITPLNQGMYEQVMADIDDLKPTFYRYKGETTEMIPGHEARYRPNLHLGVILDEAPDYIQDQAFKGIDIYAMGVLALTGVKYNREQIQALAGQAGHSSGSAQTQNTSVFVPFDQEFAGKIGSEMPLVHITPTSPNTGFYVAEVNAEGFQVVGNSDFSFNWSAEVKAEGKDSGGAISPEIIAGMQVSEGQKQQIQAYWKQEKIKDQADYQLYLETLKTADPKLYEQVMRENRENAAFINAHSH